MTWEGMSNPHNIHSQSKEEYPILHLEQGYSSFVYMAYNSIASVCFFHVSNILLNGDC